MTELEKAARQALEALEETRNALAWFYDSYPEDVTPKGNELLPHVEVVLADLRVALTSNSRALEQPAQQEPVAWRDHVEQRLLTWRQSFVNKSGDQLELGDFMDKRSLDDLIDFVCDEYTRPAERQSRSDVEPLTNKQSEPVAYMNPDDLQKMKRFGRGSVAWATPTDFCTQPVYTRPQAREWVGLTDEERRACTQSPFTAENYRAIEAKLREKNGGAA